MAKGKRKNKGKGKSKGKKISSDEVIVAPQEELVLEFGEDTAAPAEGAMPVDETKPVVKAAGDPGSAKGGTATKGSDADPTENEHALAGTGDAGGADAPAITETAGNTASPKPAEEPVAAESADETLEAPGHADQEDDELADSQPAGESPQTEADAEVPVIELINNTEGCWKVLQDGERLALSDDEWRKELAHMLRRNRSSAPI